jgi:hypothetical protein
MATPFPAGGGAWLPTRALPTTRITAGDCQRVLDCTRQVFGPGYQFAATRVPDGGVVMTACPGGVDPAGKALRLGLHGSPPVSDGAFVDTTEARDLSSWHGDVLRPYVLEGASPWSYTELRLVCAALRSAWPG